MSEDWLPHEPPPAVTPKSSSTAKTLAIWVVLVVIFLAIYNLAGTDDAPRRLSGETIHIGYSGWWIVAGVGITLAVVAGFLVMLFSGAKKFNEQQASALEALARGQYAQAIEQFAAMTRRYRAKPNFAAVAQYNHGYALLRSGDSAAAVGILLGVERTPKLGAGSVRRLAATQLARAFALGGDVEKASKWLESARSRPAAMADPIHDLAIFEAAEGVVLVRQGRFEDACKHYAQCQPHMNGYLSVEQMYEVWLLRAFAISSASSVREAGGAEPYLRMLRGVPAGTFEWITKHWPELETFAVTQGFAKQAA